jgi:peptide/nickel transport system permease protein
MVAPGLCIALTVLAVNLTGDALRDMFDPRTLRTPGR